MSHIPVMSITEMQTLAYGIGIVFLLGAFVLIFGDAPKVDHYED